MFPSQQISKLRQENEDLRNSNDSLTDHHNAFYDTHDTMANALGHKSVALDQFHDINQKLKQELTESKRRIKELEQENQSLVTKNNQCEQRLEDLTYKLSQKDDLMATERENHRKRIEELNQAIEQLTEKLHTLPDESKYHEPTTPSQSDHEEMTKKLERPRLDSIVASIRLPKLGINPTLSRANSNASMSRNSFSKTENQPLLPRVQSPAFGQKPALVSFRSNITTASNLDSMGIYDHNTKSFHHYDKSQGTTPVGQHNGHGINEALNMPHIPPLWDTPQTSFDAGNSHNYNILSSGHNTMRSGSQTSFYHDHEHDLILSEGLIAMRDEYEHKMSELIVDKEKQYDILYDKYDDAMEKLENVKNDYDKLKAEKKHQSKKLQKKLKTIKELRTKNTELQKKLTGHNKQCYVFEWFNK